MSMTADSETDTMNFIDKALLDAERQDLIDRKEQLDLLLAGIDKTVDYLSKTDHPDLRGYGPAVMIDLLMSLKEMAAADETFDFTRLS